MPKTVHVLLVAHNCSPTGGSEARVSFQVAEHLAKQNLRVTVLRNGLDGSSPVDPATVQTHENVTFIAHDVNQDPGLLPVKPYIAVQYQNWLRGALKVAQRLHAEDPFDVVHHISWASLLQGSPFYKMDIPFVMGPVGGGVKTPEAYGSEFADWRGEQLRSKLVDLIRFNPISKAVVKNAAVIVASNPETAEIMRAMGVSDVGTNFDDAIGDSELRETPIAQSTSGPLRVMWMSRVLERKALGMALAAVERANQATPIAFTLIGDGPDKARNQPKIDQLVSDGIMTDLGWCDQARIEEAYQSNDVLLYNSLRDNGSAPLHSATRFGMPAIVLDHHGPGFITDDSWAIKLPLSNPEQSTRELAQAMVSLAGDPQRRVAMGQAALAASYNNRWSDWAQYLAGVYRELSS